MLRDETHFFPSPAANALAIVELYGIDDALLLAQMTCRSARDYSQTIYWAHVVTCLIPGVKPWN